MALHVLLKSLVMSCVHLAITKALCLLQVLASMASQPDGQRALLRTTALSGSLCELLLGLLHHHIPAVAAGAAAVLRNAALLPENKAHFLARAGALQLLVDVLGQAAEQPARAAYAAGALWALVHDGEKVRRCLLGVQTVLRWLQEGFGTANAKQAHPVLVFTAHVLAHLSRVGFANTALAGCTTKALALAPPQVKAPLRRVHGLRDALAAAADSCANDLEGEGAEGALAMHEQLLASCEALALLMR